MTPRQNLEAYDNPSSAYWNCSANAVWLKLIADLMNHGTESAPRGHMTKEMLGYQTVVDMRRPVVNVAERINGTYFAFMCAEAAWILSGDNKVSTIGAFAPSIHKFSDDGRYFFGAYGPKIADQISGVVRTLKTDPDTRQAVMNIWRENPIATKDVPCTISVQFLIRDGKLHCNDTMRSSDAWLGWPFDVFNFSMLSHFVCLLLRDQGVDVEPGLLRLTAGSQHLYAKNFEGVQRCLVDPKSEGEFADLALKHLHTPDHLTCTLWMLAKQFLADPKNFRPYNLFLAG
jgi:thymidylate synthase